MLVRRDGETLNALLKRLDRAIGRYYDTDETIDGAWAFVTATAPRLRGMDASACEKLLDPHLATHPFAVTALASAVEMLGGSPLLAASDPVLAIGRDSRFIALAPQVFLEAEDDGRLVFNDQYSRHEQATPSRIRVRLEGWAPTW